MAELAEKLHSERVEPTRVETAPVRPPKSPAAEQWFRAGLTEENRGNKAAAISRYQAALALDPSHIAAIWRLGGLRYRHPHQPLLEEISRRHALDMTEVIVEIRNPCNYRCHYCVANAVNNQPVKRFDFDKIKAIYSRIETKLIVTQLECAGGEPTVHPEFPTLVRLCAEYGPISFPTNNSQDPKRWLPEDLAKRLFIRAALHPEGEEKLDRYLAHAKYLIDRGCEFQSIYVAHPDRLPKIGDYRARFAAVGVPFVPVSFIGTHDGKSYPHAYNEDEAQLIGLNEGDRSWQHQIEPHVTRIRNFRGIPCQAGRRSIYITKDGVLRRCSYDGAPLDAPLAEAMPCRVKKCGCGMLLDKVNHLGDPRMFNHWAGKVELPTLEVGWMEDFARGLGHDGVDGAIADEMNAAYDALMDAYGKDEFPE